MGEKTVPIQEIIGMINDINFQLGQLESDIIKAADEEAAELGAARKEASQQMKRNFEEFEESIKLYERSLLPLQIPALATACNPKPKYTF